MTHELFEQAQSEDRTVREHALKAAHYFIERQGEVFSFEAAVEAVLEADGALESDNSSDVDLAARIVGHLASDGVDPVTHVAARGQRHMLVSEYVEGDWWYGFEEYDDVRGPGKKVVCCQCVAEGKRPEAVGKVFELDVAESFADYDDMADWLYERHFEQRHPGVNTSSVGVFIGASLATGTTIASNTAIHTGNESQLSFFDGTDLTAEVNNSAVTTDQGTIGGNQVWEQIDSGNVASGTLTSISISGYDIYKVHYTFYVGAATSPLNLRLNGDGGSTGNYDYFDETGTRQSGQNNIELLNSSQQFYMGGGTLLIDRMNWQNVEIRPGSGRKVESFATAGGREVDEALSSIDFHYANIADLNWEVLGKNIDGWTSA